MARVTITWAGNEGNHANKPFLDVREAAIRAVYEAHKIIQARARKRLAAVATCLQDGSERSRYEGDEAAIRRVADDEPGIAAYSFDEVGVADYREALRKANIQEDDVRGCEQTSWGWLILLEVRGSGVVNYQLTPDGRCSPR